MQKGNSHQESHQCITNVVKSSAIPSGILRMNGFYCSVLITDCCYSFEYYCCICAVVDRVLMMMVMIMTLLLDGVMKTRLKMSPCTFLFCTELTELLGYSTLSNKRTSTNHRILKNEPWLRFCDYFLSVKMISIDWFDAWFYFIQRVTG